MILSNLQELLWLSSGTGDQDIDFHMKFSWE